MDCEKCGSDVPASANFCENCGSSLASAQNGNATLRADSLPGFARASIKAPGRFGYLVILVIGAAFFTVIRMSTADKPSPRVALPSEVSPQNEMEMREQRVGGLSLKYLVPLAEDEGLLKLYEANAHSRPLGLSSVVLYTSSKPACGIWLAQLSVSTYKTDIQLNLDEGAQGVINSLAAKQGIVDPEGVIDEVMVSGLPARRISFQAKQSGDVVGSESLMIVDHSTNKYWDLQLMMFSFKSDDFSDLDPAQECAKVILDSVAVLKQDAPL